MSESPDPTGEKSPAADDVPSGETGAEPSGEASASSETFGHEFVVEAAHAGKPLARYLRKKFPLMPFDLAQKLCRKGLVRIAGKRARADQRLAGDERVSIAADLAGFARAEDHFERRAEALRRTAGFRAKFRVLHEDASLIALDKPPGIVVHPSRDHHGGDTLLDLLRAHWPREFAPESPYRPAFVHRLDRGTSGVIVAAKTRDAARSLERAFQEGRISKSYIALALGRVRVDEGSIRGEIVQRLDTRGISRYECPTAVLVPARSAEPDRIEYGRTSRSDESKEATSEFRVLERFARTTLIEVTPTTGRTHQIRAHFARIGHPLAGDGDYGDYAMNRELRESAGLGRLFLHASRIELPRPGSEETLGIDAPLAPDLVRVVEALRR
jgi:23S rRNA pseudouridine955/2504/2580 synthase